MELGDVTLRYSWQTFIILWVSSFWDKKTQISYSPNPFFKHRISINNARVISWLLSKTTPRSVVHLSALVFPLTALRSSLWPRCVCADVNIVAARGQSGPFKFKLTVRYHGSAGEEGGEGVTFNILNVTPVPPTQFYLVVASSNLVLRQPAPFNCMLQI